MGAGGDIMQPATRRRTLGLLFVLLLAAGAARAAPVVADEDPLSSSTDPISDTVSDATDPISDTVSDATDAVSDTVSDATDPVSDTVSDATDPVSGTVSDATGAASTTASGTTGRGSDHGLSVGASTHGNTPTREGQHVPCDAQTSACNPDSVYVDPLAAAVKRILGFLAVTGWGVLPWIVIALGLTVLGIFFLRSSRNRTSRT
jgi:hypothetical protein